MSRATKQSKIHVSWLALITTWPTGYIAYTGCRSCECMNSWDENKIKALYYCPYGIYLDDQNRRNDRVLTAQIRVEPVRSTTTHQQPLTYFFVFYSTFLCDIRMYRSCITSSGLLHEYYPKRFDRVTSTNNIVNFYFNSMPTQSSPLQRNTQVNICLHQLLPRRPHYIAISLYRHNRFCFWFACRDKNSAPSSTKREYESTM